MAGSGEGIHPDSMADRAAGDGELTDVEELDPVNRPAGGLLDDLECVGALELVPEGEPASLVRDAPLVADDFHVVAGGLGLEGDPVRRDRPADQAELLIVKPEQDGITDDVSVVVAGQELLGLVLAEGLEAVDSEVRQQPERVRAAEVHVGPGRGVPKHLRHVPRSLNLVFQAACHCPFPLP
jgi:hypothetical protein